MNLGQLKKKIIREFAKSPAKTCTLIALCPVALYFLVPLFLPAKSKVIASQKAQVIAPTANLSATAPLASDTAVPPPRSGPTWGQLNAWIEADARRLPGTVNQLQRDPFQAPVAVVEELPDSDELPVEDLGPPEFAEEAFAALRFKLTGTLLGRQTRSATINGRRYLEGEQVLPAKERIAAAGKRVFVLRQVGARHAILELNGQPFRLELPGNNGITVLRRPVATTN